MSDFPTIVYRTPGPHWGPAGKTYDSRGVRDAEELKAALAAGWHATLPEACGIAPPKRAPVPASPGEASPAPSPATIQPARVAPPLKGRA